MQDKEKVDLSKHRLANAEECLSDAKFAFEADRLKICINRSYYAMFNAARALLVFDELDSKRLLL
jgi:uncharacterized protein (UPF0332 family)